MTLGRPWHIYSKGKFGSFCLCVGNRLNSRLPRKFYEVKVGIYSQVNDYPRSRSFIDLCSRSLRFNLYKHLSSATARPIEPNFHIEPPWNVGNENLFKNSRSLYHAHLRWKKKKKKKKNFKGQGQICFLKLLHGWKLIQHWVLMYFQVCSDSAHAQHSDERNRTIGRVVFSGLHDMTVNRTLRRPVSYFI